MIKPLCSTASLCFFTTMLSLSSISASAADASAPSTVASEGTLFRIGRILQADLSSVLPKINTLSDIKYAKASFDSYSDLDTIPGPKRRWGVIYFAPFTTIKNNAPTLSIYDYELYSLKSNKRYRCIAIQRGDQGFVTDPGAKLNLDSKSDPFETTPNMAYSMLFCCDDTDGTEFELRSKYTDDLAEAIKLKFNDCGTNPVTPAPKIIERILSFRSSLPNSTPTTPTTPAVKK